MAIHALFDSVNTIHDGPGAEFDADTEAAPAGLVFQIVGVIVPTSGSDAGRGQTTRPSTTMLPQALLRR